MFQKNYYYVISKFCIKILKSKIQLSISFSKFAEMRPKWCVLAGTRGTHSECVCVIHQNFKAIFEASNLKSFTKESNEPLNGYTDCFSFVLCRNPTPNCYLGNCKRCLQFSRFQEYVSNVLEQNDIEDVIFSVWQSTDRCTLKKSCLSVDDFILELSSSLKKLIPHHFIAKSQSQYIKDRKQNLRENEGLLEGFFGEFRLCSSGRCTTISLQQ